ncbi:MAG: hypothetical protein ACR2JJ_05755 [Sphingomicrobium sp.]
MNDEIFDRIYRDGRADLNDGIDRAIQTFRSGVAATFRKLQDVQFAAPSSKKSRDIGCA